MTVSVIVMTLNAEKALDSLLNCLEGQCPPPDEIIVADSESTDRTRAIAQSHAGVHLLTIRRETFDHGGARHQAFLHTTGEIVCFLTQDALPTDEHYLSKLTEAFTNPSVACACGRQVARETSLPEEKWTREYNYPAVSGLRCLKDVPQMGIKACFLSDVCSAYRREEYLAAGGFARPALTNEDMLMAMVQLKRGKTVAYCAEAKVWHDHRFTLAQDYKRSFDIGVFLKQHQANLPGNTANREGLRYFKWVGSRLIRGGQGFRLIPFALHCLVRFVGSQDGRNYEHMSRKQILRRSGQRGYWLCIENGGVTIGGKTEWKNMG